jgi:hypothetical protein
MIAACGPLKDSALLGSLLLYSVTATHAEQVIMFSAEFTPVSSYCERGERPLLEPSVREVMARPETIVAHVLDTKG